MISSDDTYFAMLDYFCSIKVYFGSYNSIWKILQQKNYAAVDQEFIVIFGSPAFPDLNGRCFAGIDDSGFFRVYSGHPNLMNARTIWSSDPPRIPESHFSLFFRRYFLYLSSDGELSVNYIDSNYHTPQCVWSTSYCYSYIAVAQKYNAILKSMLKNIWGDIKTPLLEIISFLSHTLKELWNKFGDIKIRYSPRCFQDTMIEWANQFARATRQYWDPKYAQRKAQSEARRRRRKSR